MKRVLVTGCLGQIGSELVTRLRQDLGKENVIATDIRLPEQSTDDELFEILDVMDYEKMRSLVETYQVDTLIHLAALLSAVAEAKPKFAWDLNMVGLVNALEVAREFDLKFFTPSSIGAFGPDTPKKSTPQDTLQRPTTMYGVTKVAGELLCDYYHTKYGVDTRGVRFPGFDLLQNSTRWRYDRLRGGDLLFSDQRGKIHLFHWSRYLNGYDVYARCDRGDHPIDEC